MPLDSQEDRIGLYFPFDSNLDKMSINICAYAQAIEKIGKVPVLIIPQKAITFSRFLRVNCDSDPRTLLSDKSIRLIIGLTWYLDDAFIKAYRESGGRVITLGDDDGMVDAKLFAGNLLMKFLQKQNGFLNKIRAFKHWFEVYILRLLGNAKWIAGLKNTDIFTLPNPECCKNLRNGIRLLKESPNIPVRVLYFPVDEHFFSTPLEKKANRIITVSRFSDCDEGQKNSVFLESLIKKFLDGNKEYEWYLIGRDSVARFSKLRQTCKGVICFDHLEKQNIAKFMSESKIMVLTSRWEGSPVSGNEMLACGGTIVGPPIPGISGLVKKNAFGTESLKYSVSSLLDALNEEVVNWDSGKRTPLEIRHYWEKRVSIRAVGDKILNLVYQM